MKLIIYEYDPQGKAKEVDMNELQRDFDESMDKAYNENMYSY